MNALNTQGETNWQCTNVQSRGGGTLYVTQVIEADGGTYRLPVGTGHSEGVCIGKISIQTILGNFEITDQPTSEPLSQDLGISMRELIEFDEEEIEMF